MSTVPSVELAPDARWGFAPSRKRLGVRHQFSASGSPQREGRKMLPPVDMTDDELKLHAALCQNGGGHASAELAGRRVARPTLEARSVASRRSHLPHFIGRRATQGVVGPVVVVPEDDRGNRVAHGLVLERHQEASQERTKRPRDLPSAGNCGPMVAPRGGRQVSATLAP